MREPPTSNGDDARASEPGARGYSRNEAARLRKKFGSIAEEQRRRSRTTAGWMCAVLAAWLLYVVLPKTAEPILFFVGLGLLVKTVQSLWRAPRLRCPGCAGELVPLVAEDFGRYCPDCGSRALESGGRWRPAHCRACDRTIGKGSHSGRYRIRACTLCGLWLDDQGL